MSIVVAGIDPSSSSTGVAVLEEPEGSYVRPVLFEMIAPNGRLPRRERVYEMFLRMRQIFSHHRPKRVGIESTLLMKGRVNATIAVTEAKAAAYLAAIMCGAKVEEYPPASARKIVAGRGDIHQTATLRRKIIKEFGSRGSVWNTLSKDLTDAAVIALAVYKEKEM